MPAIRVFWTDRTTELLSDDAVHWWEVCLRRDVDAARFRRHAGILGLQVAPRELRSPDRTVVLVPARKTADRRLHLHCTTKQLEIPDKLAACCRRPARQRHRKALAKFLLRALEFAFYRLLICLVDRLSRLPRDSCPPDAMRLYRENLALKVLLTLRAYDGCRESPVWGHRTFLGSQRLQPGLPCGVV